MKPIQRDEILDYATYGEKRDEIRSRVLEIKKLRRVHVGDNLTFLFENRDTVRYQVQEMIRTEKIVKEAEIQHEIDTYNELLGGDGELGCTLLIEIENPEERDKKLVQWLKLMESVYLKLADGTRVSAIYDSRQVGDERLSSVQYVRFDTKGETPVSIGADYPDLTVEAEFSGEQKFALADDLAN